MANNNTISAEIDLVELFRYLFKPKKILIALAAMIVAVAALVGYYHVTYVPKYEAKATLYILKQDASKTAASSDFSTALNVVNDCAYILRMESVLDEVIEELGLNTSYGALRSRISTSNPEETRILEVRAQALTPDLAVKIADSVCRIGTQRINDSMGFKQVRIAEEAQYNPIPCNKPGLKNYALIGMLAMVAVFGVYVVLYLLDDGIHSDDDVQRYLGLSVLGRIPDLNSINRQSKYRYETYGHNNKKNKRNQTWDRT